MKRGAREQKAGLLAWFQTNWGRLLEAAQATNTWFDVGIVLGPIMGYIDEGMWGFAQSTADNYNLAIEALYPGYTEERNRIGANIDAAIERSWDETWGSLDEWDNEQISEWVEL